MEVDIYAELPESDTGEGFCHCRLQHEVDKLNAHIKALEQEKDTLRTTIDKMKATQDNLARNISELFNTAKNELQRKDRTIADLRQQLDDTIFRRRNAGGKRYREQQADADESQAKRHKFSENTGEPQKEVDLNLDQPKTTRDFLIRDHRRDQDNRSRSNSPNLSRLGTVKENIPASDHQHRSSSGNHHRNQARTRSPERSTRHNGDRQQRDSSRYSRDRPHRSRSKSPSEQTRNRSREGYHYNNNDSGDGLARYEHKSRYSLDRRFARPMYSDRNKNVFEERQRKSLDHTTTIEDKRRTDPRPTSDVNDRSLTVENGRVTKQVTASFSEKKSVVVKDVEETLNREQSCRPTSDVDNYRHVDAKKMATSGGNKTNPNERFRNIFEARQKRSLGLTTATEDNRRTDPRPTSDVEQVTASSSGMKTIVVKDVEETLNRDQSCRPASDVVKDKHADERRMASSGSNKTNMDQIERHEESVEPASRTVQRSTSLYDRRKQDSRPTPDVGGAKVEKADNKDRVEKAAAPSGEKYSVQRKFPIGLQEADTTEFKKTSFVDYIARNRENRRQMSTNTVKTSVPTTIDLTSSETNEDGAASAGAPTAVNEINENFPKHDQGHKNDQPSMAFVTQLLEENPQLTAHIENVRGILTQTDKILQDANEPATSQRSSSSSTFINEELQHWKLVPIDSWDAEENNDPNKGKVLARNDKNLEDIVSEEEDEMLLYDDLDTVDADCQEEEMEVEEDLQNESMSVFMSGFLVRKKPAEKVPEVAELKQKSADENKDEANCVITNEKATDEKVRRIENSPDNVEPTSEDFQSHESVKTKKLSRTNDTSTKHVKTTIAVKPGNIENNAKSLDLHSTNHKASCSESQQNKNGNNNSNKQTVAAEIIVVEEKQSTNESELQKHPPSDVAKASCVEDCNTTKDSAKKVDVQTESKQRSTSKNVIKGNSTEINDKNGSLLDKNETTQQFVTQNSTKHSIISVEIEKEPQTLAESGPITSSGAPKPNDNTDTAQSQQAPETPASNKSSSSVSAPQEEKDSSPTISPRIAPDTLKKKSKEKIDHIAERLHSKIEGERNCPKVSEELSDEVARPQEITEITSPRILQETVKQLLQKPELPTAETKLSGHVAQSQEITVTKTTSPRILQETVKQLPQKPELPTAETRLSGHIAQSREITVTKTTSPRILQESVKQLLQKPELPTATKIGQVLKKGCQENGETASHVKNDQNRVTNGQVTMVTAVDSQTSSRNRSTDVITTAEVNASKDDDIATNQQQQPQTLLQKDENSEVKLEPHEELTLNTNNKLSKVFRESSLSPSEITWGMEIAQAIQIYRTEGEEHDGYSPLQPTARIPNRAEQADEMLDTEGLKRLLEDNYTSPKVCRSKLSLRKVQVLPNTAQESRPEAKSQQKNILEQQPFVDLSKDVVRIADDSKLVAKPKTKTGSKDCEIVADSSKLAGTEEANTTEQREMSVKELKKDARRRYQAAVKTQNVLKVKMLKESRMNKCNNKPTNAQVQSQLVANSTIAGLECGSVKNDAPNVAVAGGTQQLLEAKENLAQPNSNNETLIEGQRRETLETSQTKPALNSLSDNAIVENTELATITALNTKTSKTKRPTTKPPTEKKLGVPMKRPRKENKTPLKIKLARKVTVKTNDADKLNGSQELLQNATDSITDLTDPSLVHKDCKVATQPKAKRQRATLRGKFLQSDNDPEHSNTADRNETTLLAEIPGKSDVALGNELSEMDKTHQIVPSENKDGADKLNSSAELRNAIQSITEAADLELQEANNVHKVCNDAEQPKAKRKRAASRRKTLLNDSESKDSDPANLEETARLAETQNRNSDLASQNKVPENPDVSQATTNVSCQNPAMNPPETASRLASASVPITNSDETKINEKCADITSPSSGGTANSNASLDESLNTSSGSATGSSKQKVWVWNTARKRRRVVILM